MGYGPQFICLLSDGGRGEEYVGYMVHSACHLGAQICEPKDMGQLFTSPPRRLEP